MAAKGKGREIWKLQSTESHYFKTGKFKKGSEKVELKMFDPVVRKHVPFKQTKLK